MVSGQGTCNRTQITNRADPRRLNRGRKDNKMRFDRTEGKKAKYMVSIHYWNNSDQIYFHYYKDAKAYFDSKNPVDFKGAAVNLYDITNDIRKAYKRF